MKCDGCRWQTAGKLDDGTRIAYCIASPDYKPPEEYENLIDKNRIVEHSSGHIYRAEDYDECHYYLSPRFESGNRKETK